MVAINLGPAQVDLAGVRAGDRNLFNVTVKSGGSALNLTGYTVKAAAKVAATDVDDLDAVCTITNAPGGVVAVRWPGAAVRTWLGTNAVQKGKWDLQLDDGSGGDPWTVISGEFSAELDITP